MVKDETLVPSPHGPWEHAPDVPRLVLPDIAKRQRMERSICRRLILDAVKAGYTVGVHNGEEVVIRHATSSKAVLAELFSVDEERLLIYRDGKLFGEVLLVYGNSGYDVVCDYSSKLEPIMAGAQALADRIEDRLYP